MSKMNLFGRGHGPLPRLALTLGVLALPLSACEDLLNVEDPDIVDPGQFTEATALPSIRLGAIGDFHAAYVGNPLGGGGTEGQILLGGLLSDEWIHSGTFPTRSEVDIRKIQINNGTVQGATRNLYRARSAAEAAINRFEELGANTVGHAEVLSLAGFTYIYFAENYCEGVPFSRLNDDGSFEYGGQTTRQQVLEMAVDRFDRAIAAATAANNSAQLNLARVGKARALLNMNQPTQAAAVAAQVPTNFTYLIRTSTNSSREQNGVFVLNWVTERWSVANNEGGEGLPYRTAGDPRVQVRRDPVGAGVGFDRTTPQWRLLKYPGRDAPVPVANGAEARLIEAEAALRAGNLVDFLRFINAARVADGAPTLELTDLPATQPGRVDLLFRERAFSLYATSHRLGDMRRLIRDYGRPTNTVFPEGRYHKNVLGGTYGEDTNIPISIDERNSPEFSDFPANADLCLNRNP